MRRCTFSLRPVLGGCEPKYAPIKAPLVAMGEFCSLWTPKALQAHRRSRASRSSSERSVMQGLCFGREQSAPGPHGAELRIDSRFTSIPVSRRTSDSKRDGTAVYEMWDAASAPSAQDSCCCSCIENSARRNHSNLNPDGRCLVTMRWPARSAYNVDHPRDSDRGADTRKDRPWTSLHT
jgi:hypothetical protein